MQKPAPQQSYTTTGGELRLLQGDLTRADADAVVNAANPRLAGGGGVDGAIHRAAGPELPPACQAIIQRRGPLAPGDAEATPGFNMSARWIIHTVGPFWKGGDAGERDQLAKAFLNSLRAAHNLDARRVAFPAISTGVYGFPVEEAAPIALQAVREGLTQRLADEVDIYLHSPDDFEAWRIAADALFGDG